MKKRIFVIVLALVLSLGLLSGCGQNSKNETTKKLSVVCTIFPQYDWVKQIIGNQAANYKLTLLLDNGVDFHSYQPTAEDIATISKCDIFIYVGGESDGWVEDVLKEATNPNMQVINFMDVLKDTVKEEEIIKGMESEDKEEEHSEEGPEYDEHVWLSLRNTQQIVAKIAEALEKLDASNSQNYKNNYSNYEAKLKELDAEYTKVVSEAKRDTLLFGDRFPFRYLVADYNLTYYAAFVGCSAQTEASFETIAYLSKKVEELQLPVVLTIENSSKKIAQAIIDNTTTKNQKILSMSSLQSVTNKEIEEGATYVSIMEDNLKVLEEVLN